MKLTTTRVFVAGAAALAFGICAEIAFSVENGKKEPVDLAVAKGLRWLVSVQGKDGGWGQDGGETSYVRQGENLESKGNDVANTAVVAEALLHTGTTATRGEYREPLQRAIEFILKHVEESPADGLAVTNLQGTQIQRKLGPYIDTFLTSKVLAELDGAMPDAKGNARVRQDLRKCVAKIEKAQLKDGSWNIAGGWAPILGTSLASQSLFLANAKGAVNGQVAMDRVNAYTVKSAATAPAPARVAGSGGGVMGGVMSSAPSAPAEVAAASANVPLYAGAQQMEQLSRTAKDRQQNAGQIKAIASQLSDTKFVTGFGSIGGEEFFSYLNISESLRRTGGPEWKKWNTEMTAKLLKLQNDDGTWAGHHCITGRVAVTSAAILLLQADHEPAQLLQTSAKKR